MSIAPHVHPKPAEGDFITSPSSHRRTKQHLTLGCAAVAFVVGVGSALAGMPVAHANDPETEPPYHILSAQDLCNLVWPASEAMPDPAGPEAEGFSCVRQGGVLLGLSRAMPAIFSNAYVLAPGKVPELPAGSARVNPGDPLSDWVIPDCDIPSRIDCSPNAPGAR